MHYDLIIIGGGLVGSSLALGLKESGLKVALIDARLPSSQDGRLFALNQTSCHLLQHLGVWSSLQESSAPIKQVHVSNQGQFGSVRLKSSEAGLPQLGHVVPAFLIEKTFQDAFSALPADAIYRPAYVNKLSVEDDLVRVQLSKDGQDVELTASLIVGADGAESTVRKELGIASEEVDYQQLAIVTRTKLKRGSNGVAYERFNKEGAIAMLPLPDNECATIWTADAEKAKQLLQLTDNDFLQALQKAFGYRLGRLQSVSKRFHYPLKLMRSKQNVSGRICLLGNAAHAMHPIAAQGFNLALYEVATLIELIESALQNGKSLDASIFCELDAKIKSHQSASIGVSHQLTHLFSKESKVPNIAIALGMVGLDVLKPVKTHFIQKMMGSAGRLPRLLLSD